MLRYIIGGVALAATGYGVKKYLESDINIFENKKNPDEEKPENEKSPEKKE